MNFKGTNKNWYAIKEDVFKNNNKAKIPKSDCKLMFFFLNINEVKGKEYDKTVIKEDVNKTKNKA